MSLKYNFYLWAINWANINILVKVIYFLSINLKNNIQYIQISIFYFIYLFKIFIIKRMLQIKNIICFNWSVVWTENSLQTLILLLRYQIILWTSKNPICPWRRLLLFIQKNVLIIFSFISWIKSNFCFFKSLKYYFFLNKFI